MNVPPAELTSAAEYGAAIDNFGAGVTGPAFTLANYGDGEWGCIIGQDGENAQGGRYTPELRQRLAETLSNPRPYFYGTNPGKVIADDVGRYLASNPTTAQWVWKETLAAENVNGGLGPFIRALRRKRILIVGPKHLRRLADVGVLWPDAFVEVPLPGAQDNLDALTQEIREVATANRSQVILFSAGMASKVMIWRLWPELGQKACLIDTGAILDPYVGVTSRKGYRKRDTCTRMAKSLVPEHAAIPGQSLDEWACKMALACVHQRKVELRDGPFDHRQDQNFSCLYWIAKRAQARSIFEIGVRAGYSAYMMLAAMPEAWYHGLDLDEGTFGGRKGYVEKAREFLSRFDPIIQVSDSQKISEVPNGQFDLINIDGDHSEEGCLHDLNLVAPTAQRCIVVHDYFWIPGIRRACATFLAEHPEFTPEIVDDGGRRGHYVFWKGGVPE